ncbi:MAG: DUF192 domain-containing protein [Treponema sp.]|jgi:uncharacterized membrane protein (UPF0127 family)|nr:DUF192 domain-containing protein [Treponema sp.]
MNFRPALKNFLCFTFIIVNTGLAGCASHKLKTAVLSITRPGLEPVEITVEIARTEAERAQGLMHRKKLPDGEGMIFIFERDEQLSFWMKNTVIPLSIAFIASDGRIVEIKQMQPLDLNSVKSSRSVRYALETPQGWFDRAGVKPGDVVGLDF